MSTKIIAQPQVPAPMPPKPSTPTASRTIDGRTVFWRDRVRNVIHACETAEVHPGTRLVWTFCLIDVPANASYTTDGPEFVTCAACAKLEGRAALDKVKP